MKVTIEDYPGFHERMSRLRETEIGLDGAICAEGGEVRVHLPYMAACNQTLFNRITSLVKQGKSELNANKMSLKGIQIIVDYCYTGDLDITEDNFEHIIDAALGLEFLNIAEQCVQFALTSNVNANIWCHFLRAAFKHPRSVQTNNFVPDLILHNITKIPKDAIIKGLDASYIREMLDHGTFDETNKSYAMNVFLEIMLADKADIKIYKEPIMRMKDKIGPDDKLVIPKELLQLTIMPLMELSLDLEFTSLVEAGVEALGAKPLTADVTSQILKWMKQYEGSAAKIYLKKLCYHAYKKLPLDIDEDDFSLLLESDCVGQSKEIDIFKTALRWIEHHNASLETNVRIISLIRFGLMSKDDVDEIVKDFPVPGCEKILFSAIRYHLRRCDQPLAEGHMNKMRLVHALVYIIGGKDSADNYNEKVLMSEASLVQGTHSLSPFTEISQAPCAFYESACAEMNGFIFVSGGADESLEAVDSLFRFDPRTSTWLELERMSQKRDKHTITAVRDTLIAAGGCAEGNELRSVERYDVRNNTWTDIEQLPEGRNQHAASCVDGVLYITGGSITNALYCRSHNAWTEKTSMLHVRQCHAMAGISGMLVVAGGTVEEDGKWRDVMSTECYDVIKDQWTELSPLKCEFQLGFYTRIHDWMYIFGGYSDHEATHTDRVQRYNIESNEWELCEIKLPNKMSRMVGACVSTD